MDWKDIIVMDQDVLCGKPIIRGTRLSVEFILELLSNGWTEDQILKSYPQLKIGDLIAAFKYTTEILKEEKIYMQV